MEEADLLQRLASPARKLVELCGRIASERGEAAFLVGGTARDLVLGRVQADLDVVVEGDGMAVAQALARAIGGQLTRYHTFQTARVDTKDGYRIDLSTARSEAYPRPGQLPQVVAGSLQDDLLRRDFTINALAISLDPTHGGELIDPCHGLEDLQGGVIRALHGRSFADDATRILRALRFARRLDYRLDRQTDRWLREAVAGGYLDTVSGNRIQREIAYLFTEFPVEGPVLLARYGVLEAIHTRLRADEKSLRALADVAAWYGRVERQHTEDATRSACGADWGMVLAVCAEQLSPQQRWALVKRLRLSRSERRALIESGAPWLKVYRAWKRVRSIALPTAGAVERLFRPLSAPALQVVLATCLEADESELVAALRGYLETYQWLRPRLTGQELLQMGLGEGPQVGKVLDFLLAARLEGRATSLEAERQLVMKWLAGSQDPPEGGER